MYLEIVKNLLTGSRTELTLPGESPVLAMTLLHNDWLASGSGANIRLWDNHQWQCIKELKGHTETVRALTVLPKNLLASGGGDKTICLWDIDTGKCIKELKGHKASVYALTALPNGWLASSGEDLTIRLWDTDTGDCIKELKGHGSSVATLTVLPNGWLASGCGDKTIRLWDTNTGECIKELKGHANNITALAVLPNGLLVSASGITIRLWDVQTGKTVKKLVGHKYTIRALTVLENGLLASGGAEKTIRLWDTQSGKCVKELTDERRTAYAMTVLANGLLASVYDDTRIHLEFPIVEDYYAQHIQTAFEAIANNEAVYSQRDLNIILQECVSKNYQQQFAPNKIVDTCLEHLGSFFYTYAEGWLSSQTAKTLSPTVQTSFVNKYLYDSLLALTLVAINDDNLAGLLYQVLDGSLLNREFASSNTLTANTSFEYVAQLFEQEQQQLIEIATHLLNRHYQLLAEKKGFNPAAYFKSLEILRKNSWLAGLPLLTFYQMAAALAVQTDFCSLQSFQNLNHIAMYIAIVADNTELLAQMQNLQPELLTQPAAGWTPGLQAAEYGSQAALYWLLAHTDNFIHDVGPANKTIWDVLKQHKHTALEEKLSLEASKAIEQALALAKDNDLTSIKQLHYMFSFDINQQVNNDTLLFVFTQHKNLSALQWLQSLHVNYAEQNSEGKTVSLLAGALGWLEGVQFLHEQAQQGACLTHEAVRNNDMVLLIFAIETAKLAIDTQLENGDTALILTVKHNRQEMLLYLLQHKADINLKTLDEETAIDIALYLKHAHLTTFLQLYANPMLLQAFQPVITANSTGLQQFSIFAPTKQPAPTTHQQQETSTDVLKPN